MLIYDVDMLCWCLLVGNYITTADVFHASITVDSLWGESQFERAIALHAVRRLLVDRGADVVGADIERIHGECVNECVLSHGHYTLNEGHA